MHLRHTLYRSLERHKTKEGQWNRVKWIRGIERERERDGRGYSDRGMGRWMGREKGKAIK